MRSSPIRPLLALILAGALGACATATTPPDPGSPSEGTLGEPVTEVSDAPGSSAGAEEPAYAVPIIVGSKDFTEAYLLGEMYALVIEATGLPVERQLGIGATPIAQAALERGDIDLYPEYTSTALLTVLKEPPMQDRDAIYLAVKTAYAERFGLTWLDPSPFNNPQALATRKDVAEAHGLATYSQLSEAAPELVIGGPPEFFEREDGLPGLQTAYGGFQFKSIKQLDPGLRYPALLNGDLDVVLAFGTDGQIAGNDLVLLEDDKSFFTPYPVAPVVRAQILQSNPEVADALNALAPHLTNAVMQRLNWAVDGPEGGEPADVARRFLQDEGLIE